MSYLGIWPRKQTTYVHTNTCICMFIAVLFIMAKNGGRLSVNRWVVKQTVVYLCTGKLSMPCPFPQRNEYIPVHSMSCMKLKNALLTSQKKRSIKGYCVLLCLYGMLYAKPWRQNTLALVRSGGKRDNGMVGIEYRILGVENTPEIVSAYMAELVSDTRNH